MWLTRVASALAEQLNPCVQLLPLFDRKLAQQFVYYAR